MKGVQENRHIYEGGNAVTLTLLGLAVAILAGVVVLYFIGKSTPQPIPNPTTEERISVATTVFEEDVDPREGWRTYENEMYLFSMEYPVGWAIATGTVMGSPVVTLYDASQVISSTTPIHELDARVSVYPLGLPTGGTGEEEFRSEVIVSVPQSYAKDLRLGAGRPWATIVYFELYPDSWNESGYVYARTPIEEEEEAYMRGDTGISPEEYDVYAGDRLVRYGYVDTEKRALVEEMLRSLVLIDNGDPSISSAEDILIHINAPQSYAIITSPVLVQGDANGTWYFEGDFPVRLETSEGDVLAEVPATALGDWMSDEYVPFEVSLAFASTTATSGVLVFSRNNPSGLPEHDKEVKVPIFFTD